VAFVVNDPRANHDIAVRMERKREGNSVQPVRVHHIGVFHIGDIVASRSVKCCVAGGDSMAGVDPTNARVGNGIGLATLAIVDHEQFPVRVRLGQHGCNCTFSGAMTAPGKHDRNEVVFSKCRPGEKLVHHSKVNVVVEYREVGFEERDVRLDRFDLFTQPIELGADACRMRSRALLCAQQIELYLLVVRAFVNAAQGFPKVGQPEQAADAPRRPGTHPTRRLAHGPPPMGRCPDRWAHRLQPSLSVSMRPTRPRRRSVQPPGV
jgi:hypothetical protein